MIRKEEKKISSFSLHIKIGFECVEIIKTKF